MMIDNYLSDETFIILRTGNRPGAKKNTNMYNVQNLYLIHVSIFFALSELPKNCLVTFK